MDPWRREPGPMPVAHPHNVPFTLPSHSLQHFSVSPPPGAPEFPAALLPPPAAFPKPQYRPQLSAQEWDTLRPAIKRLYIDEKKTFSEVAKFLRENHDFNPTKRQFDGKIVKWGLRKNRKQGELPKNYDVVPDGRKASPSQQPQTPAAGRWRSESGRGMVKMEPIQARQESETRTNASSDWSRTIGISTPSAPKSNSYSPRSDHNTNWPPSAGRSDTMSLYEEPVLQVVSPGQASSSTIAHSPLMSIEILPSLKAEPEPPKTIWDMTNITGSPRLTSLFTALKIDEEFPLLPPAETFPQQPKIDVFNADTNANHPIWGSNSSEHAGSVGGDEPVSPRTTTLSQISSSPYGSPTPRFKIFIDQDSPMNAYFREWTNLVARSISPLDEINPFPDRVRGSRSSFMAVTKWNPQKPMDVRIGDCEDRLGRLEKHLPRDSPAVISAVQKLAKIYLEVGKSKEAESLYLRAAIAKQKFLGTEHPETVMEYLNIINAKQQSGDYLQSVKLHEKLHAKILEVFGPESELGINSLSIMAGILYHLEKKVDSERLHRQSLQLALSHLGRRHPLVPSIMADLGVIIWFSNKDAIKTSEQLVREGLSIDVALNGGVDKVPLHHFGGLAWILPLAGYNDEAAALHRSQVRRCWRVEGMDHFAVTFNLRRLGKSLRMMGDYVNSEPKSRLAFITSISARGEDHRQTIDNLEEVVFILDAMHLWVECSVRSEELWNARRKKFGAEGLQTKRPTDTLRRTYAMQGLYKDDLEFAVRLEWIKENSSIRGILMDKQGRSWDRYEMDLEPEEKEVRRGKKGRMRYGTREEHEAVAQFEVEFEVERVSRAMSGEEDGYYGLQQGHGGFI